MKNIKYIFLIIGAILTLSSCEKYFDDVNLDPNNPANVPANRLLPSVELRINYAVWGDGSRFAGIYNQHIDGASRQFLTYQGYTLKANDFDNVWGQFYIAMKDIKYLKLAAEKQSSNSYHGVGSILEAYTLLFLTDFWGSVPYSDANQGFFANAQPKFDSQAEIFQSIFSLLADGKAKLADVAADGAKPGSDDLVYKGDLAKWVAFANGIEARARLHMSKKDASQYALALTAAESAFTAAPLLPYTEDASGNSPWYQYNEQRNDIVIGDSYVSLLTSLNDPRSATYGQELNTDHPILTPNQSVPFMSLSEISFIKAECLLHAGRLADAKAAYIEGIGNSFAEAKVEGLSDYLAQSAIVPSGDITLGHIMTQKYIALFLDPEAHCDWRRTGIPTLIPNTGDRVPRRFIYAETEILYNKNTPTLAQINQYSPVDWD